MRRATGGSPAALLALVVGVLLLVGGPAAIGWATDRPEPDTDPSCRTVAFMSMVGLEPDCR
ncbi:hypothetical protein DEJ50_13505 [Streptomyces venezuelae]|uniref:Uncharacterized protein n=1 Tax=Streptomyces venezuelae TaxID=54571 RepID=A0A5P2D0N8_STRVZ|nr:hypothetical protein [Streptomyces venezuelae]QES48692.1 hypothetical protein DEJ50_13505 [Streptomyces venezuelae]